MANLLKATVVLLAVVAVGLCLAAVWVNDRATISGKLLITGFVFGGVAFVLSLGEAKS